MSKAKSKSENPMKKIFVAKLTLNVGTGTDQKELTKAKNLIKHITGIEPVETEAKEKVATWGIREGLPIGCKLTLRGDKAKELIPKLLDAKEFKLKKGCFDNHGNISFGIKEYIDIKDVEYNPDLGMMGLQASITLERPGFRVKKRRIERSNIPQRHQINKEEAIEFMEDEYDLEVEG